MSMPRLVLVSRRFWPLVGGAETVVATLAANFQAWGAATTVLTARWQSDWPAEIEHHGVRVVRLPQGSRRFVGTWRYMRSLSRWLRKHRGEFDLVYVSMLKHDAYACLGAARRGGFPVALLVEGGGLSGDVHWQLEDRFGRLIRRRCDEAAAIVAASPAIRDELIAAGYRRERIHFIPNGVAIPPERTTAARREARAALAALDPALGLSPEQPLAIFTGRLHEAKGLRELVAAWQGVVRRCPGATLWLVGEGPLGPTLADDIERHSLRGQVVLTGAFDDVGELLLAADLFVLPSWEEGMSLALLEAMAAGLPSVVSDIPGNRLLVDDGRHGLMVPMKDTAAIEGGIVRLLNDPALAGSLGAAARARVEEHYSHRRMVDANLALFDQLLHQAQARGGR